MIKPVIFLRTRNEYRVIIEAAPDWEGFNTLIKYLEMNYNAKILNSYDSPDARRWILDINKKTIELIHSDGYGNYLISPSQEGEKLIEDIGKDLEEKLKDVLDPEV